MTKTIILEITTALACALSSVFFHMWVLRRIWKYITVRPAHHLRHWRMAFLIAICMTAHFLEICLFALGFALIAPFDNVHWESLQRTDLHLEVWYYSSSFYTSLGSADPPSRGFRLLGGLEALTGLILITWTASFLYLIMSRTWEGFHHH
jgi:hypothetical protein